MNSGSCNQISSSCNCPIKNHFHINGFALSLALKVRFFGTRKWPIVDTIRQKLKEIELQHRMSEINNDIRRDTDQNNKMTTYRKFKTIEKGFIGKPWKP